MSSRPAPERRPRSLRLRPERLEDEAFLIRLYASTREDLAGALLSSREREMLLGLQFRAQREHYRNNYPGLERSIVLSGEEPCGRLYVERRAKEVRLADISLLPEYRGRGLGSELVAALIDESGTSGARLSAHVERGGRALGLYARLGFRLREDRGAYLLLVRENLPGPVS